MKSGREKKRVELPLHHGERMLLESPGGLLTAEKNRWQMGVWQASDRTLIFSKERIVL